MIEPGGAMAELGATLVRLETKLDTQHEAVISRLDRIEDTQTRQDGWQMENRERITAVEEDLAAHKSTYSRERGWVLRSVGALIMLVIGALAQSCDRDPTPPYPTLPPPATAAPTETHIPAPTATARLVDTATPFPTATPWPTPTMITPLPEWEFQTPLAGRGRACDLYPGALWVGKDGREYRYTGASLPAQNIRAGPGVNYPITGSLPAGEWRGVFWEMEVQSYLWLGINDDCSHWVAAYLGKLRIEE